MMDDEVIPCTSSGLLGFCGNHECLSHASSLYGTGLMRGEDAG